ncbi:CRISPR-associated protein Cas4, partial [bacterium 1XD42-8]
MDEYREEEFLLLSGIQHFAFCRRQWALIHIEQQWQENEYTVEGELMHKRAHDPNFSQKRGDIIVSRSLPVFSRIMGVKGVCDIVEFHKMEEGVKIHGHKGLFQVYPIEYKRGRPKETEMDILQLTAQAICLEEMLLTAIPEGAIFYGETRRREKVELTEERKDRAKKMFQ